MLIDLCRRLHTSGTRDLLQRFSCLSMSHEVLIGTQHDVDDVLEACAKVQKYSATA